MLGRTYDEQVCSIARALEVLGERWTLLIVRDALCGIHRFDDLRDSLGLARNVLADRLKRLVAAGVLERIAYQQRPERFEYRLSATGAELALPIVALMQWGDTHTPEPGGPPRQTRHRDCGGEPRAALVCDTCGQPVTLDRLELVQHR
jgi:DNA-binding HxlR family transcriptional regulator